MEQMLHYILNCLLRVLLEHAFELIDEFVVDDTVEYLLNFSDLRDSSTPNYTSGPSSIVHRWCHSGGRVCYSRFLSKGRIIYWGRHHSSEGINWLCFLTINCVHKHL